MRIQISSGRGPVECEIAVRLYCDYLLKCYPGCSIRQKQPGQPCSIDGKTFLPLQSVVLEMPEGTNVQTGVVKWICQSPVRKGHRRKNWFIEVSRLEEAQSDDALADVTGDFAQLDSRRIRFETFRSPGKGGQNVNKVETGARVIHIPSGTCAESVSARTQLANKKLALERLRQKMLRRQGDAQHALATAEWKNHDQLERGNAFAVFSGMEFGERQAGGGYSVNSTRKAVS